MTSKIVLSRKASEADRNNLNSTQHDSEESSSLIGYSEFIETSEGKTLTAPLKNYKCSRFIDHFKSKEVESGCDYGIIEDFSLRNKSKYKTIMNDKSKLNSKLTSVEEEEDFILEVVEKESNNSINNESIKISKKGKMAFGSNDEVLKQPSMIYGPKKVETHSETKETLSLQILSEQDFLSAILKYKEASEHEKSEIDKAFLNSISLLLSSGKGVKIIKAYFYKLYEVDEKRLLYFVSQFDFKSFALTSSYQSIIDIIKFMTETDNKLYDIIYEMLNSESTWMCLIPNKYGKNLVEGILTNFYRNEIYKHSILFQVIHSNFTQYSKSNYTTFVVQKYISNYQTRQALALVEKCFDDLLSNRNGIFVIISSLKSFKIEKVSRLLSKIFGHVEHLCKGIYTSTMMEFVFKTFPQFGVDFVNLKIDLTLGKIIY